jgi:transposase
MTIMTVGIDLAKNVFSLHGVGQNGKQVLRRTVRRDCSICAALLGV